VLGLTIDYGPYGWLDDYDPDWTPNTTDAETRRYRFGQQPAVAQWNLVQLAQAILPLIGETRPLEEALQQYAHDYRARFEQMMAAKLGLRAHVPGTDAALLHELDTVLRLVETDMTIFFRALAAIDAGAPAAAALTCLEPAYYRPEQLTETVRGRVEIWLTHYLARLRDDGLESSLRRARMNAVNPKYVLRNYLAQLAIEKAEQGDDSMIHTLLEVLRQPYAEQPGHEAFAQKRPDWARHRVGCSMLSCSS